MAKLTKESVYEAIQKRIFQGELPFGSRISELGLSKELGVSRTPVREAFARLVHEGIAEYIPNAGVYLKKPTRQDIWELYDLRTALETHAVAALTENLSPNLMATLEQACRSLRDVLLLLREARKSGSLPQPADYYWRRIILEGELPFHLTLVRSSQNTRLAQLVSNSQMLIRIYGINHVPDLLATNLSHSYWEHRRILLHIKRGDLDKAAKAMRLHLTGGRERTLGYFDRAQEKAERSQDDLMNWTRQIQSNIDQTFG